MFRRVPEQFSSGQFVLRMRSCVERRAQFRFANGAYKFPIRFRGRVGRRFYRSGIDQLSFRDGQFSGNGCVGEWNPKFSAALWAMNHMAAILLFTFDMLATGGTFKS